MIRRGTLPLLALLLSSCELPEPSEGNQFWLNWGINAVVAVMTLGAVLVALFGARWVSQLFPPDLRLTLLKPAGEKGKAVYTTGGGGGLTTQEDRRFYHVRVSNARRSSQVDGVQVYLFRIDEPDENGEFRLAWNGQVPMTWRNQQAVPFTRSFGHDYDCDLCSVGTIHGFSLAVAIVPLGMNVQSSIACKKILWLQAQGVGGDSPTWCFKIDWDGVWNHDDEEMSRHLVITQTAPG